MGKRKGSFSLEACLERRWWDWEGDDTKQEEMEVDSFIVKFNDPKDIWSGFQEIFCFVP